MNKLYKIFFWFCVSILVIFLSIIGYIRSVYGPQVFDQDAGSYVQKQIRILADLAFKVCASRKYEEEYLLLHDHLLFLKDELGQARINEEVRQVIFAQSQKPIKKTIRIEPETILEVGYGIIPDLSDDKYQDDVKFSIVLETQNKKVELLSQTIKQTKLRYIEKSKRGTIKVLYGGEENKFQTKVDGNWQAVKWRDSTIDLAPYAGENVTINFITENMSSASPWAVWSYPQIYQRNKISPSLNVLIVSLDTLRADHLNCYQYKKRVTSPNMDKLAEEGLLFKNFYSNSPATFSSQMSILTGLYPSYHGLSYRNWGNTDYNMLPTMKLLTKDTLAYTLAEHGYFTLAYTGGGFFIANLDYSRGFHLYNNTVDYTLGSVRNVFPKAFKWLELNKNKKFFMFLHTYEIHHPFTETYYADKEAIPHEHDYKRKRALYDGGILLTDQYIEKLVSVLKKNDLLAKTILIITSDHGEELGDRYGVTTHGETLFNEQIRVPCIMLLPPNFPQRKVIDTVASSVDLAPTILDILGIKNNIKYSGKSLLPIIEGDPDNSRFAYSEDIYYGPDLVSLVKKKKETNKFLFINPSGKKLKDMFFNIQELFDPSPKRLFNLVQDPGERYNLTGRGTEDYISYQNIINDIISKKPTYVQKPRKGIKSSKKALESLKSLGYIQ